MAVQVVIPKEGSGDSCIVAKWNFKVDDKVRTGDLLCEIETDKSVFDLESPVAGTILDIFYDTGAEAPALAAIAVIGEPGEAYSKHVAPEEREAEPKSREKGVGVLEVPGKAPASPRARRLAREKGVPMDLLVGSGADGSIIERDVLRWLVENQQLTPAASELSQKHHAAAPRYGTGSGDRVTVSNVKAAATGSDPGGWQDHT